MIEVLLVVERRLMIQRRSPISNYSSIDSKIGSSQIPSALGTTITGALANIPFPFGIDPNTGEYGYRKAGADAVTPFSSGGGVVISMAYSPRLNCWGVSYADYGIFDLTNKNPNGLFPSNAVLTALKDVNFNVWYGYYMGGAYSWVSATITSDGVTCTITAPNNSANQEIKGNSDVMHVTSGSSISITGTGGYAGGYVDWFVLSIERV